MNNLYIITKFPGRNYHLIAVVQKVCVLLYVKNNLNEREL